MDPSAQPPAGEQSNPDASPAAKPGASAALLEPTSAERDALEQVWGALGGDDARARAVELEMPARYMPSAYDISSLACASIGA